MGIQKTIARVKALTLSGSEPTQNADPETNGEYSFLARAAKALGSTDCVVDVGASKGDWTDKALKTFDAKQFLCFEPMPYRVQELRERFSDKPVLTFDVALSDRIGATEIHSIGGGGRMNIKPDQSFGSKQHVVYKINMAIGDDVLKDFKPSFIKIDCDGHDEKVLRGLTKTIATKRPVVQFEYCDMWLLTETTLAAAARRFAEADYVLHRVFPDHIVPFRFNFLCETYSYQNVAAVPREKVSLFS